MEQLDNNKSYFFLFDVEEYTLEQVRSFSLEECYQHCINKEWCDDTSAIDEDYNLQYTNSGDWGGEGEFIHTRIASGETYRVYELLDIEGVDNTVQLNDGRTCYICNDPSMEWGGIAFEDESRMSISDIPIPLLDELVQKSPLVESISIQQLEEEWYKQESVEFITIREV
jgi:hypothetical protein